MHCYLYLGTGVPFRFDGEGVLAAPGLVPIPLDLGQLGESGDQLGDAPGPRHW